MREAVQSAITRLEHSTQRNKATFNLEVGRFLYAGARRRLHEIAGQLGITLTMTADKGLLTHWVTVQIEGEGRKLRTFLLFVEALIDANADETAA